MTWAELTAASLGSFGRYSQRLLDGGPCQEPPLAITLLLARMRTE